MGYASILSNCASSHGQFLEIFFNLIFTALHGMQTRSSDENSVRPSVRPSVCLSVRPPVCHTREL